MHIFIIDYDICLYDFEGGIQAKSKCTLSDELGVIEVVLSDKTGTLTQNKMVFKKFGVSGVCFGSQDVLEKDENIQRLLLAMALCHTVLFDENASTEDVKADACYSGESADEVALVKGSAFQGYSFCGKEMTEDGVITLKIRHNDEGRVERFQLLQVLEFTSDRRRMSVILKTERKEIWLICKGADNVVRKLLDQSEAEQGGDDKLLDDFSNEGLRTLMFGQKTLSETDYELWDKKVKNAASSVVGRQKEMEQCFDEMENHLSRLGVTAVEDRLQEGVVETIKRLRRAGIHVWMLTGDKKNTALNVAYACGLFDNDKKVKVIDDNDDNATISDNDSYVIVSGRKLGEILRHLDIQNAMAEQVDRKIVLVGYRCTPAEKAAIAQCLQKAGLITLAIGDGANDVAMIKGSRVGCAIAGSEGRQAALAADYVIGQFRFLGNLLLYHGLWNYRRVAVLAGYSFYKGFAIALLSFWFSIYSLFSGQTMFESWTLGKPWHFIPSV